MRENTRTERRIIAEEVNGRQDGHPAWIESTDELLAKFKEYAKRDHMQRMEYDTLDEEKKGQVEKISEFYADLSTKTLDHDMPALIYFFRRYLTQH